MYEQRRRLKQAQTGCQPRPGQTGSVYTIRQHNPGEQPVAWYGILYVVRKLLLHSLNHYIPFFPVCVYNLGYMPVEVVLILNFAACLCTKEYHYPIFIKVFDGWQPTESFHPPRNMLPQRQITLDERILQGRPAVLLQHVAEYLLNLLNRKQIGGWPPTGRRSIFQLPIRFFS